MPDCRVWSLLLAMWSPRRSLCSHILKEVIPALVQFVRPVFTGVFASRDLFALSSCLPMACLHQVEVKPVGSGSWSSVGSTTCCLSVAGKRLARPRPLFSPVEWVDLSSSFWKVAVRIYTVRFCWWPVRPMAVSSVILCQFFLLGP